jgi:hypothetical protein
MTDRALLLVIVQGEKLMEWAMRKPGQAQFNRFLYDRYVGACVSCE